MISVEVRVSVEKTVILPFPPKEVVKVIGSAVTVVALANYKNVRTDQFLAKGVPSTSVMV